jgi:SSS family solute:Na+ symporter
MSDELALLARVSFTGTAMMAPVVIMAVITKGKPAKGYIVISSLAFITYVLSLASIIPNALGPLRIDLALYLFLVVASIGITLLQSKSKNA